MAVSVSWGWLSFHSPLRSHRCLYGMQHSALHNNDRDRTQNNLKDPESRNWDGAQNRFVT